MNEVYGKITGINFNPYRSGIFQIPFIQNYYDYTQHGDHTQVNTNPDVYTDDSLFCVKSWLPVEQIEAMITKRGGTIISKIEAHLIRQALDDPEAVEPKADIIPDLDTAKTLKKAEIDRNTGYLLTVTGFTDPVSSEKLSTSLPAQVNWEHLHVENSDGDFPKAASTVDNSTYALLPSLATFDTQYAAAEARVLEVWEQGTKLKQGDATIGYADGKTKSANTCVSIQELYDLTDDRT